MSWQDILDKIYTKNNLTDKESLKLKEELEDAILEAENEAALYG